MNARFLDVFHDTGEIQLFTVEESIDIDFDRIIEESIN